jgi:hypothetical protein
MALTLGTDTYQNLAALETYAAAHFGASDLTTWDAATDAVKETAARQATQYIESEFMGQFLGGIRSTSQDLQFPRNSFYDNAGRFVNDDYPKALTNAHAELVKSIVVGGADLVPNTERGGMVKREKVDVIEIEYADGAPASGGRSTYRFAALLLKPILDAKRAGNRLVRV